MTLTIQKALAFLGFVRRLEWSGLDKGDYVDTFKLRMSIPTKSDVETLGLFCTGDRQTLYFFPWKNPKFSKAPRGYEDIKKTFKMWSKRAALEEITIWTPDNIKNLKHTGFLKEIEYTSDKFEHENDSGDFNLYIHRYKTPPPLFINCPVRMYCWGVHSGKMLMNERGLIG